MADATVGAPAANALPDYSSIDVGNILKSTIGNIQNTLGDITTTVGKAFTSSGAGQQAIQDASQAQQDVNTLQMQASLKLKKDTSAAASAAGLNPDTSTFFADKAAEINQETQKVDQYQKSIADKSSQSFLDNPIQYMVNQGFDIPFEKTAAAAHQARIDSLVGNIKSAQGLVSNEGQILSATDNAASTALLNASNKLTQANANKAVADSQIDIDKLGISVGNVRMAANQDQFQDVIGQQDLLVKWQQLAQGRMQLDINQGYRGAQQALADLSLKERSDKDEDQKVFLDSMNNAIVKLGGSPTTILGLKEMGATQRNAISEVAANGNFAAENPDLNKFVPISASPSKAVDLLNTSQLPGTPGMNYTAKYISDIADGEKAQPTFTAMTNAEGRNILLDNAVRASTEAELKNINPTSGLFHPAPLSSVLKIPVIAASDLGKALMPLAAANVTAPTDPNQVLAVASKLVQDAGGNPTASANAIAAQVSNMFRGIAGDNAAIRQYTRFGITKVPGVSGVPFNMSIQNPQAVFGGSRVIDMTNQSAVAAAITHKIIADHPVATPSLLP